jgi:Ca2+-binding EF-hand superfamily protein
MSILNEEIIAKFREAFEMFDTNQDGAITYQDLAKIFILLGITLTDQELLDMINEVDINRDDIIEYNEYISLIARRIRDSDLNEEQQEVFNIFDSNRDGKISVEELKFVMSIIAKNLLNKEITDEEIMHMFSIADKDEDGFLSYEEFDNIINQQNSL